MTPRVLFGGSFDPPHLGHLELADLAVQRLGGYQVDFVPAGHSPFKPTVVISSEHRLALLELLLAGRHGVLNWELARPGPSYTIDTVRRARAEDGREPVWLLGADCLATLARWHCVKDLFAEAHLQLVARQGVVLTPPAQLVEIVGREAMDRLLAEVLPAPRAVASHDLRRSLAAGESPAGLTGPMLAHIRRHGLYGAPLG